MFGAAMRPENENNNNNNNNNDNNNYNKKNSTSISYQQPSIESILLFFLSRYQYHQWGNAPDFCRNI